jgi:hypothetical protein
MLKYIITHDALNISLEMEQPQPIKIGFTGNRNGLNPMQIQEITNVLDAHDNIILAHGDCVGADTYFHNLCCAYRTAHPEKTLSIHIYPPSNRTMRAFNVADSLAPEKPYLERNMDIIRNSDMLLACPIDKNKEELRSGTWSTIRQARKFGIPVNIL